MNLSWIKLTKIREYVKALSENGTYLPEKYAKHLDGEIWELRPIDDRKQPQIARMERGDANLQLDTLLKVLAPLGKTLAIVPLQPQN